MFHVEPRTWFETTARANFAEFLGPLADRPLLCLQLGCFAGDASAWILENLPHAQLVDVDTFSGSAEHEGIDFAAVKSLYDARMAHYGNRVTLYEAETEFFLSAESLEYRGCFDFVYVDADHRAASVLRDAVMAWPLLKSGGLMAFDDYLWGQPVPRLETPRPAIDAFTEIYRPELVTKNAQCWVRKR